MDNSFGRWIKNRRRLLDMTQGELAGQVGCSPTTVRKLEADERRPSKQMAMRLAQSLAIPAEELNRFLAYARMVPASDPPDLQVQSDEGSRPRLPAITTTHADWGEAPDVRRFYGRTSELAQLRRWLIDDGCRLVGILGMGGIGKTSLAVKLAQGVQGQFEVVVWRSLRNAPPVEEILDETLRVLSPGAALDLVPDLDHQIKRLLDQLRRQRCLILLDNFEAIFAAGEQAGTYRVGYAGYGELLARVGQSNHQSCLLITSRENPTELATLHGTAAPLRTFPLSSLAPDDSRALLADKGLSGQVAGWAALSATYSGNPLVLQVVGESIRELFQGDIDRFLHNETALFGSIRDLLAGQFARLSPLEQSLLIWLTVHREPVGPEMLHDELEPVPSWAALLDALHSLRRRALVEQGERGFTLQNVVLEFVTDYLVTQIVYEATMQRLVFLARYPLLQTPAPQYVRDSQARLLLKPVVDQLVAQLGKARVATALEATLAGLRREPQHTSGYGAGNLLNLLVHLKGHLRGQDFSGLAVRLADLQGVDAQDASFRGSHLDRCDFSYAFKSVQSVAFSPVGGDLVIGSDTGVYCLRRLQDDYRLHKPLEPSSHTWAVDCSPDGRQVVAGGIEGIVRIWDIESGHCLHTLEGHAGQVWSACFSPDGHLLATGGADGTIRVWDPQSEQCLAVLAGHTSSVHGLCFHPGGKLLASAGDDGAVRLWANSGRPEEIRCLGVIQEHTGMVWTVAFSPDGALLASGGNDRTIRLWDVQTGQPAATLAGHSRTITRVCFSPDGSRLASSSYDGTVRIWERTTGQCVHTAQGHTARVWAVAFSPDGSVVASGSTDQSVRLWEVGPASGSGRCLKMLRGYSNSIGWAVFSPDGTMVASGSSDRLVRLWEPSTGRCLATLRGHRNDVGDVAFSPDGRLLASGGYDSIIRVWDIASGRCVHEIEQELECNAMSFHPSGMLLATGNVDGAIRLWDVRSWQLLATLRGHTDEVWAAAFSPDGSLLASGSVDQSVRLWDWRSGRCLRTFQGHTSYVSVVNFSPDGLLLGSSSWDGTVRLWDVTESTGVPHEVATLPDPGHVAQLFVGFSPDGSLLASAGVDGTICLREVNAARRGSPLRRVLEGHTGEVWSLDFRYDGNLLASASGDGTIRLWETGDVQRGVTCVQVLRVEPPYARMDIAGVTGLTTAQVTSLLTLGAVEAG